LLVETVDEVEAAFPGLQAAFVDALDQIGLLVDKDFFGLSFDLFVDVLVVAFVLVQDLESGVEQVAAEEGDLSIALRMNRDADGSVGQQRRQGRELFREKGWVRFDPRLGTSPACFTHQFAQGHLGVRDCTRRSFALQVSREVELPEALCRDVELMVEVVGSNVLRVDSGELLVRRLGSDARTNPNEKLMLCV
jgi:hypothetical protein